jgi:hypothetical protein
MTCERVLGIIDGGGVIEISSAERAAAGQHASGCARCGPAWETGAALATGLAGLPRPSPPPDILGVILARVAQIDAGASTTAAVPAGGKADWPAWLTAAGILAVATAIAAMPSGSLTPFEIRPLPTRGAIFVLALSSTALWAPLLVAGLVMYVVGLVAPVGRKG